MAWDMTPKAEPLEELSSSGTEINYKFFSCGHIVKMSPDNVNMGVRCTVCNPKDYSKATQNYKRKLLELREGYFELVGPYKNKRTNVLIKHIGCGYTWEVRPSDILHPRKRKNFDKATTGCPNCNPQKLKTSEEYGKILKDIWDDEYIAVEDYKGAETKILHKHKTCGEVSLMLPHSLTKKGKGHKGCHYCHKFGIDYTKPSIVYYLKILGGEYYKIGITNYTVEARFSLKDLKIIETLKIWSFDTGEEARLFEKGVLAEFKEFSAKNVHILTAGGNTELFIKDVLGLDNE